MDKDKDKDKGYTHTVSESLHTSSVLPAYLKQGVGNLPE